MCRIFVSLGLVRSIPESRFFVLFLACVFSLNPILELLLGRGHTQVIRVEGSQSLDPVGSQQAGLRPHPWTRQIKFAGIRNLLRQADTKSLKQGFSCIA